MDRRKWGLLALIALTLGLFLAFDGQRFFSLDFIKGEQQRLSDLVASHPFQMALGFFVVYVLATGLSLPGASILTLLAGALFGLLWGTVLVSFASSIGATLAFLASRFILREGVKRRFAERMAALDEGMRKDGVFYLLSLRLIPVVPFFVVNLLMGLTAIPARTYYWVSQLGMLLGTVIYVNLGTRLAQLTSVKGLLSPALLASLVLLGLAPLIARSIVAQIKARRVYAGWKKPARFDRNLVVIGAGAAGLVSAYIAAAVKAKVSLIERHKMGGDCLNYGCVPSKALIKTAKVVAHARHAQTWGLSPHPFPVDFAQVMDRVAEVVRRIEPHDSVERYEGLGVECLMGQARIKSPWEVEVAMHDAQGLPTGQTRVLSTRNIIIASGAQPFVPPIPGIESVGYLTSDTLWSLRDRPARLLVLGGGPIGCELSQAFCRLGSGVTQVEMGPRLMVREDEDVSQLVLQRFRAEGIDVRLGCKAVAFELREGRKFLLADQGDGQGASQRVEIEFDVLLCAVGRSARVSGFGLEELKVPLARGGTIEVNEFLETNFPNILVAGDAAGPYQFTHTAAHMAWYAAVNALFGRFRKFRVDYRVIPWATFTEPEVARVGLNEQEARAKGIPHEVTRYGLDDLDRAIADGGEEGFIKVLTVPGKDRILGVTIVGEHAGDLIAEYVMAMKHGLGLNKILGTIHIYPTLAEANKYVAGEWKRAHAPQGLLAWVEKFHAWSRR